MNEMTKEQLKKYTQKLVDNVTEGVANYGAAQAMPIILRVALSAFYISKAEERTYEQMTSHLQTMIDESIELVKRAVKQTDEAGE